MLSDDDYAEMHILFTSTNQFSFPATLTIARKRFIDF